jgi:hypothetical protein
MQAVNPIPIPPTPLAIQLANNQLGHVNAIATGLITTITQQHRAFWNHPTVTPADILEAMGPEAAKWLQRVRDALVLVERAAEAQGRTLADELPEDVLEPKLEFEVHDDGTVTLIPDEDRDAWGRPIPEPEPEPEPEEEPEAPEENND